jgi:molecular chaperone DnaK (HSP70)
LEPILVIDFGTVYSCAALVHHDQVELIHEPSTGLLGWPSSVLVDGSEILVGSLAESRKVVRAAFYRSDVKRYLSRGDPLSIGGREYPPEELISAVLAAFGKEAARVSGGPVAHAVLTKPASYRPGDRHNEQMISAGEAAGFQVVELLPEPAAAAFSVTARDKFAPDSIVLVYDWGGGTFDAALVRVGNERIEVIDSKALPYCGGVDIDEAVARFLCSRDKELDALFTSGDKGRIAVLDLADRMKRELSERPDGLQDVMGIEASLTIADFEEIARPLVGNTIDCCRELLAEAEYGTEDLAAVFIAGGSSRIPLVASELQAKFGLAPRAARDPELAVVRGAAQWASRSESRSSAAVAVEPDVVPLRWDIPGDSGTVVDWQVGEGQTFPVDATLARVRLADGTLLSLKATAAGVLRAQHARTGDQVTSGYWLATTNATASGWVVKASFSAVAEYAGDRSSQTTERAVSLAWYPGSLYVLCGTCCYVLELSSRNFRLLFRAESFSVQGLRTIGNFREMRPNGDSLLVCAGRTHDTRSENRWFEINRRTGKFLREVSG